MLNWICVIVLSCLLSNVEARSFKKQETALVQEQSAVSVQADYFCGQWGQLESKCTGTGVSETNKNESECREWCESMGVGCCETRTTGDCKFVAGNGASEWSPESPDSRATYCIGDAFTTVPNRYNGCGWDNADAVGQRQLPGIGHTLVDCQNECLSSSTKYATECNWINWGGGYCQLYTTCVGDNGGFWMVQERVTAASLDLCDTVVCSASNDCTEPGTCDSLSGICTNPKLADGTECNDNDPSTAIDECTAGLCANLCANVTCVALDDCHVAGTCDITSGICTDPQLADGTVCDDNDPSTTSDQCAAGVCSGSGAGATGDPHFVGFDGSRYDFQGIPGSVFNLITDEAFQLNARFVESPADGKTYMGVVAAKVGPNEVVVTPDVVVVNDRSVAKGGYVYLYDGEESLGLLIFDGNRIHVKALSFQVDIIIAQEGEFVYLNVNAAANSDHLVHPHGVLGQTAEYLVDGSQPHPVRLSHKNLYASGFLAGSPDDYLVADGLLGTDFAFNRFGKGMSVANSQVSRRFGFGRVLYQKQL